MEKIGCLLLLSALPSLQKTIFRKLFVKLPWQAERIPWSDMVTCLKNVFKGEYCIEKGRTFIKICYGRGSWKKKDVEHFQNKNANEKFTWPHNGEAIELLKSSTNINGLRNGYLNREIIEDELLISDVGLLTGTFHKDLERVFPKMKSFRHLAENNKIVLIFHTPKDALEAFQRGKDVLVKNWKVNVLFNRVSKKFGHEFGFRQLRSRSPPRYYFRFTF